jgi:hypothetical protein
MTQPPLAADLGNHVTAALLPFRADDMIATFCRGQIATAAALLPAAASRFFGFECRLGEAAAVADFLARIDTGGRQAWAPALPPAARRGTPAWRRLEGIVRSWIDPRSPLHDAIANIWVEFDLARPAGDPLVPSIFIGTDEMGREQRDPARHAWLLDTIEHLGGGPLGEGQGAAIAACLAELPPAGKLFQTAVMLPRPGRPVRLCVRAIGAATIADYLRRIGWPGPAAGLRSLVDRLAGFVDEFAIAIDVGADGIGSKIGIECYVREAPRRTQRLAAFVDHLRAAGLCTAAKAAALALWPGLTHERWCKTAWPADLRDHPERPAGSFSGAFWRVVHHFKISFDPPAPLEAKAYLAARFVWVDDVALRRNLGWREAAAQPPAEAPGGASWTPSQTR